MLKEVKEREAKQFLEFALDYFEYMAKLGTSDTQSTSVLVKIVGLYNIGVRRDAVYTQPTPHPSARSGEKGTVTGWSLAMS